MYISLKSIQCTLLCPTMPSPPKDRLSHGPAPASNSPPGSSPVQQESEEIPGNRIPWTFLCPGADPWESSSTRGTPGSFPGSWVCSDQKRMENCFKDCFKGKISLEARPCTLELCPMYHNARNGARLYMPQYGQKTG